MARKIELRTGILITGVNGAPFPFDWGKTMMEVLRHTSPGQGLPLDLVLRCVEAQKPIAQAVEEGAESVTLPETEWLTLKERLDVFPWGFADPAIAEFGLAIRNAPEIT